MNSAMRKMRRELRDWLIDTDQGQRSPAETQDHILTLVEKYAPAPGDNDGMTFNEAVKGVCQTMTEFDLWDEGLRASDLEMGDSVIDAVRRLLRDVLEDELADESAEFQGDCDDGKYFWCAGGLHWVESGGPGATTCEECGTEDCSDHGDVMSRDEVEDEAGLPTYPDLCGSCLEQALAAQDARDEV